MSRYLVTTFKVVPQGTEGAVSIEGTVAGILASIILASVGCYVGQVSPLVSSLLFNVYVDTKHGLMKFFPSFCLSWLVSFVNLFGVAVQAIFFTPRYWLHPSLSITISLYIYKKTFDYPMYIKWINSEAGSCTHENGICLLILSFCHLMRD